MGKQRTLIFVGAHPDDESFSVGATLAHYALLGVKTYYICATRGEVGEPNPGILKNYSTLSELRCNELKRASKVLGLTDVIHLNYRDSGKQGCKDNKHPLALVSVPLDEVVGRIVTIFRELKPDVVITFDPMGGYNHPDHIVIHNATVKAFYASQDPKQYPDSSPPFQLYKMYFSVTPHRILRIVVRVLSFFGKDMSKWGRDKKFDLVSIVKTQYPVNAVIKTSKKAVQARDNAALCHVSMVGNGFPPKGILNLKTRLLGHRDYYMRAYPPVTHRIREKDLFEGIDK